ncbi:MAG: hypothetical protein ACQEP9_01520 [Bacillota bacterium]
MKKYFSFLIILGLILLAANPVAAASKQGTKAYGMGGAFTAIADDASAVYWNPAGLTQSSLIGVQANAGSQLKPDDIQSILDFITDAQKLADETDPKKLADGLSQLDVPDNVNITANGLVALNLGKFGVGGVVDNQFSFSGKQEPVGVDTDGDGKPDETKDIPGATANNNAVGQGIVAYGNEFIDPPLLGSLSWGVSGKFLYSRLDEVKIDAKDITSDNSGDILTIEDEVTDTGVGADVGALMTISTPMIEILELKAGGTVKNIVSTLDGSYPSLERTSTVGLGAELDLLKVLTARLSADLEMPENSENIQRIGAEGTLGLFSLRTGAYGSDLAESDGRIITYGAGFNIPFMDLNLAGDTDGYMSASGTFNF